MPDTPSSAHDRRLERIVADYLHAIEAGQAPDRVEILKRHPDLADDLGSFFRNRDAMERLAEPVRRELPPLPETVGAEAAGSGDPRRAPEAGTFVRYFGDYELLVEIARGGMGVVFRARQVSLNRIVAVKMILAGQLASQGDVQRFKTEAEEAANLDHPNILPIYEVGEHDGQQYFSMKLIEGGNLSANLPELAARPQDAVALVARLARAIHYAHQRGILHRDLKPANVLLDGDGTPYITDFGLAKRIESDGGLTRTGAVVGTPSYMPPEQARAEKQVSTAVDVYSLGAILYELVSGRPPFQAASPIDTILQVVEKEPEHPRAFNPRADRDLSAIALKCLQKRPEDRYDSASALADDLERWLHGEPTRARPPSLAGQAWRWLRRNAGAAAGVTALGVAIGLTVVLFFTLISANESDETRSAFWLYPPQMGPLNPLRWIQAVDHSPLARNVVFSLAAVLGLANGWLIRLVARPKTTHAALAAAAATGMIAALIVLPVLSKLLAEVQFFASPHPVKSRNVSEVQEDDYLKQFLSPENKSPTAPGHGTELMRLRNRAVETNRLYEGLTLGWFSAIFVLVFFLGLTLASTWAAEYVARSDRGVLARIICYLELYVPVGLLVVWCLCVVLLLIATRREYSVGGPSFAQQSSSVALGASVVAFAHAGVVRRWHGLARLAIYLACIGVGAAWVAWASAPHRSYNLTAHYDAVPPDDTAIKNWLQSEIASGGVVVGRHEENQSFRVTFAFQAGASDLGVFYDLMAQCNRLGYQGRSSYEGNLSDQAQVGTHWQTYWVEFTTLPGDDKALKAWLQKQPLAEPSVARQGKVVRFEFLLTQETPPTILSDIEKACAATGYKGQVGRLRAFGRYQ